MRDIPLFILAGADMASKLQKLIRASGGPFSTEPSTVVEVPSELTIKAAANGNTPSIVVAHITAPSPEWLVWFGSLSGQSHLAPIVVTDHPDVLDAARMAGVAVLASETGLHTTQLSHLMETALSVQNHKSLALQVQHHLDGANQRFRDMADLFADWLWEIDPQLNIAFSSARKRPAQGAAKGSPFVGCFLPEERLRIEDDFAELARNPRPFHERDYWSADPYGTRMCWSVSGVPIFDHTRKLIGFRGIARDISPMRASTDQLYYLVNHDPLTGLTNRNRFTDELARTLRTAKRESRNGALLLLDIDRFALVNQTHGHAVGDKLLVHFAQVLKDNIRTGDVLARLNGDQFALLLRDLRPEDLDDRLARLQGAVTARPLTHDKGVLTLSISGGVATYPADATDPDQLLTHAQHALHTAKERGPNKIERFSQVHATVGVAPAQLEWVEFVTECLNKHNGRMVLHYQPIVPLQGKADKEFYEVLVRMVDPAGNVVVPSKFIATAEEFGMVPRIDRLVTTRAIEMLQFWHKQGRAVHLSVNLSAKTFDDETFQKETLEQLKTAGLPERSLVFEITETAILRDLQQVKNFMTTMREAGAGFALDDCGVGYSSFNYIRHLDLDFIKIDGSFVRNLHLSGDDQAFVKALADVARQKNISTVAEMVEHEAAALALKDLGIDFGQGFYFAPPAAEIATAGNFIPDHWDVAPAKPAKGK